MTHGGLYCVDTEAFAIDLYLLKSHSTERLRSALKQAIHSIFFKDLSYEERKKTLHSTTTYKENVAGGPARVSDPVR